MNFIEDTKAKVAAAKIFFQKKAKPIASMAAAGMGAVLLASCGTTNGSSSFNSFPTRQTMRVTQTTISPDGRSRTTTSQFQEHSRYEEARARREDARTAREWARAVKEARNAFKDW